MTTKQEIAERASDWSDDVAWRNSASVSSVSMIFSMPEGTDPESVLGAVRSLAFRELGDNNDYVLALHTDTPRPHVHLAVQAMGDDRKRFNPGREQLHLFREEFAIELRKRGIEASATPRRARGLGRAGSSMALRQIRDRQVIGAGEPARQDILAAQHSVAIIKRQVSHPPFVEKPRARWESIREAYVRAAAALVGSGDGTDRALGEGLAAFAGAQELVTTPELLVATYEKQMRSLGQGGEADRALGAVQHVEGGRGRDSVPFKPPPERGR